MFQINWIYQDSKYSLWEIFIQEDEDPVVIDWESASFANPYGKLLEDALCWIGFL